MARKFLTAIDLAKNELQNGVIQNLAAAPPSPAKGQLYFDSTGNVLYWWNGTAWVAAQGGAGVAYGSVPAETTFGLARADGVATTVARSDHTHGSPAHSAAEHSTIPLDALAVPGGNVNMNGKKITNVADPTQPTDAANKLYVDNAIAGLSWKDAVKAASTANVLLSPAATSIDGVTITANDRVLLKNQSSPALNGIYYLMGTDYVRALDADAAAELNGAAVYVEQGTTQGDTSWSVTSQITILGTDAVTWVQFAGGGAVTAGAGMTQSGNTLNVIGDATMTVAADSVGRAALAGGDVTAPAGSNVLTIVDNAVTNNRLANMNANTIKGNNTGSFNDPLDLTPSQVAAVLAGYVGRVFTGSVAAATSTVITHNLGTRAVAVDVYRTTTPYDSVDCDVERTDVNNVTVRFAVAPGAAEYNVVVVG